MPLFNLFGMKNKNVQKFIEQEYSQSQIEKLKEKMLTDPGDDPENAEVRIFQKLRKVEAIETMFKEEMS